MNSIANSFIYVFDAETKDKLLALSFTLLKENTAQNMYVFINDGRHDFTDGIKYVISDVLTF